MAATEYRRGNFQVTLKVVNGVMSAELDGDASWWDVIGVVESYRALLRIKVLHDYQWPNEAANSSDTAILEDEGLAPRLTDTEPGEIEQRILREEAEILNDPSPFG